MVAVRAVIWRERSVVLGAHVGVRRERSIVLGVRTTERCVLAMVLSEIRSMKSEKAMM